jgi:hypothetical protein
LIGNTSQEGKKRQEVGRQVRQSDLYYGNPTPFRLVQPLQTSQKTLNLLNNVIPRRPRYFIGKEETLHPKILAKPSILFTIPIGTNYDLAKLIFKLETASKHSCISFATSMRLSHKTYNEIEKDRETRKIPPYPKG